MINLGMASVPSRPIIRRMVNSSTKVDIEAPATELVAPTRGWVEELGEFWRALPGKAVFGVLLAGWAMLFTALGTSMPERALHFTNGCG